MKNPVSIEIHNQLSEALLNPEFLQQYNLKESFIKNCIEDTSFLSNLERMIENKEYGCTAVLSLCKNMLNSIYGCLDETNWLLSIYNITLYKSFPNAVDMDLKNIPTGLFSAAHVYLEILRVFSIFQKQSKDFTWQSKYALNFLTLAEENSLENPSEYKKFKKTFKLQYIYEMMKLNQEILKHSTLDHICGVHFLALSIGRQFHKIDIPIDLGRVSGSAAGHDIGKFGCKSSESRRVPYLHYYYTDEWFKKNDITYIGHIALNHSVWDLELENLSLESLILIYSDFRVKNKKENMHIYSLKESFEVILKKLDNVDASKEKRYTKVYSKLKDFEDYMLHLGINVNPHLQNRLEKFTKNEKTYYPLIHGKKIIKHLKYLSIRHNTHLMHKLRDEFSLHAILELAKSEDSGINLRTYLQIFEEYSTYLTQKQKLITIKFLYEQIIHPEDDIRRQCAELIGTLIAMFDEDYRKEIPENVTLNPTPITSYELLDEYLNLFIHPDHKIIDIHQKWIGYSIRIMISFLFSHCNKRQIQGYKEVLCKYYQKAFEEDKSIQLYLLNTIKYIPLSDEKCDEFLFHFILEMLQKENENLRISALDTVYTLLAQIDKNSSLFYKLRNLFENKHTDSPILAENFLNLKIVQSLELEATIIEKYVDFYNKHESQIAYVFLNNLKASTPWIFKKININLLLDYSRKYQSNLIYTALHFCNILKVSGIEHVRNSAGKALIEIMPYLSLEQRNDIAVELLRSLEIEGYQFSKYIPYYLGKLILYLQPIELDELLDDLIERMKQYGSQLNGLLLKTLGISIEHYPKYKERFSEDEVVYQNRHRKILGILLNGLAHYDADIKQTAFTVIGKDIFGSKRLTLEEKQKIFTLIGKKSLTLLASKEKKDLIFFTNAAALNYIYRFISDYGFFYGNILLEHPKKIAFFPGTFDPFSLGHKEIAKNIQALGFEVYLSVDEFSWSKKTQPNLFRRNIINMSMADELNIYLYPEDIPINISNPRDMKILKRNFPNSDVYMVMGSDVILNASAYKKEKTPHSIHAFSHIIFDRKTIYSSDDESKKLEEAIQKLEKETIILNLPPQYEDISSTQIRSYVDENRDISKLIDPLSQKYVYEKGLYQREAQYKTVLEHLSMNIEIVEKIEEDIIQEISTQLFESNKESLENLKELSKKLDAKLILLREDHPSKRILGFCAFHGILWNMLFQEFKNSFVSEYIRQGVMGRSIIIDGIFITTSSNIDNLHQIMLTEVLSYCIERDYNYAIYKDSINEDTPSSIYEVLELQGFYKIPYESEQRPVYVVNMSNPCILNLDVESIIKEPFRKDLNVKKAIASSRKRLQRVLTSLYPGHLVLSFDRNILYGKLIKKICCENKVPVMPLKPRSLGNTMCVPFGDILKGIVVPNTVTKSLHTEKSFTPDMKSFSIAAFPYYLDLETQIKTIRSFNMPIILVDDLLNKGYRIKAIDPILKKQNIQVQKIIVGILSGRGKELMDIQGREVDGAYFIPNLRIWFNENALYPFMGGDTLWRGVYPERNLVPSVNLIFPYTSPSFLLGSSKKSVYHLSKVCIENAIYILETLEKAYEEVHQRNLTLNYLGEVFISPRCPDRGKNMYYDLNLNPSHYLRNDLELLYRMENLIHKI